MKLSLHWHYRTNAYITLQLVLNTFSLILLKFQLVEVVLQLQSMPLDLVIDQFLLLLLEVLCPLIPFSQSYGLTTTTTNCS